MKQLDPTRTVLGEKRAVLLSPSTEALALVTISTDTKKDYKNSSEYEYTFKAKDMSNFKPL